MRILDIAVERSVYNTPGLDPSAGDKEATIKSIAF
jgi:hypothetical protein